MPSLGITSNVIHLPHLAPEQLITRHASLICQLPTCLHAGSRHLILEPLPRRRLSSLGKIVREGQVFGQQAELSEDRRLVPADVLVIQPVAADVDDGGEGDLDVLVRWRDTRYAGRESVWSDKEVEADTHSQSISLSCVKLKTNSSMTRSTPTVRLTSSMAVSSGLLNTK